MTRASLSLLVAGLTTLGLSACQAKTDVGASCKLTKPCTPGPTCNILVSDTPNKQIDYIALGSPECDDQVCLRTGKPDLNANPVQCTQATDCAGSMDCSADGLCVYNDACVDTTTTTCADTAKKAMGYCTKECINDSDCSVDYRGGNKMICRQLNFSPDFLAALKAECASDPPARDDPCTYNTMFGAGAASNYCIAPRSAAAGP